MKSYAPTYFHIYKYHFFLKMFSALKYILFFDREFSLLIFNITIINTHVFQISYKKLVTREHSSLHATFKLTILLTIEYQMHPKQNTLSTSSWWQIENVCHIKMLPKMPESLYWRSSLFMVPR